MDQNKIMIIIDNEVVTHRIAQCSKSKDKVCSYVVRYKGNSRFYNYSYDRISVLTNVEMIDISENTIYYKNSLLKNIKNAYHFYNEYCHYYRIIFKDDSIQIFNSNEIYITGCSSKRIMEYIKEISNFTSLETESGQKILSDKLEKVNIDNLNQAIANYLKLTTKLDVKDKMNCLIFPFGCNMSQYIAVENAIHNRVSVIEGPPGTGKTQTILNIIANLLIRGKNCQVVSNNNPAIENIDEKLKRYGLDFLEALLGKNENKIQFVNSQKEIPLFLEYENFSLKRLKDEIVYYTAEVKKIYEYRREIAVMKQSLNELSLEYQHFLNYINENHYELIKVNLHKTSFIKRLLTEVSFIDKISFSKKMKYVYIYRIGNFKFYRKDRNCVINSLKNSFYIESQKELEKNIKLKESYIEQKKNCEQNYINASMNYLKRYLSIRYSKKLRKVYSLQNLKKDCKQFVKDYPVVLSTTYSSTNTFPTTFLFDYIIMDESSQVDIATGFLSLSSAINAVIIGDEKQLQNVVTTSMKSKTDSVAKKYAIEEGYLFSTNSFLSSIKKVILNIPITLLREHYRCHPKIINFCNKKFYNNQLIIMTEDKGEKNVIKIIKTNKGNHSRERVSRRQIDVMKEALPTILSKDIGVIAPYNNQVNAIIEDYPNLEVNTVHKFQGREKDAIIISTVDDEISDFVANDNILNVAISRAKKQLYFIVTGNEIKNKNINDFIDYVQYNNFEIEESKIYSVFDLLYKQYEKERIEYLKKHPKVSIFDSENIVNALINKIVKEYDSLEVVFMYPLKELIRDTSSLDDREIKYVDNYLTHVDFLIYNTITKKTILVIEVDGYKFHKEGTEQHERDLLKNSILQKCSIPFVRLNTVQSEEEKRIRSVLDEILKSE